MRAYVESYGCTLNRGEASEIEDLLRSRGWSLTSSPAGVDLVVLVACVVIESTERRMLRRVKALSSARRLIVTGCLATARKDVAMEVAPSAEFIPPGDMDRLSSIVEVKGAPTADRSLDIEGFAIVPIASGCIGNCAYCITRLARGSLRSRSPKGIVSKVAELTRTGPREVRLSCQDTGSYGIDIKTDLVELLDQICAVEHDFRLRIGMMNPWSALPMLDRLADRLRNPKIFKFLHLPVQSASNHLLEMMERGYKVSDFETLVSRLRSAVPELTISTDVIVGYPGESHSDHEANLSMLRRIKPDIVNITRFSPRPGTKAAKQGAPVVGRLAKQRSRELTRLRFEIAQENNERMIGRTEMALATERGRESSTILRSDAYKQIIVRENVALRKHYKVAIVEATPTHLLGELV